MAALTGSHYNPMQSLHRQPCDENLQPAPFEIAYLDVSKAHELLADDRVMAAIQFGAESQLHPADQRIFTIGLPELGDTRTLEVWYSRKPLRTGLSNGIRFVANDDVLFANVIADETTYPNLEAATYDVYHRMLQVTRAQGYPHLLRVWNYFPHINSQSDGLERYQRFCVGRYQALETIPNFEGKLPAACAIGTRSGGFLIYVLAARVPGVQVENPRQVSAFHYPKRYGPRSPSFSRAVLKSWGSEHHLYISGTASIVGHETQHAVDTLRQLDETLNNLGALIAQANRHLDPTTATQLDLSLIKTYVRHGADLTTLRERIGERFGADTPTVFLRGDICRGNLLIELDAVCVATYTSRGLK